MTREARLKAYHRLAKKYLARGLTAHGAVRQRRPKLTDEERRQYGTAKKRLHAIRVLELGLTTRGTKRKTWCGRKTSHGIAGQAIERAVKKSDLLKQRATLHAQELLRMAEVK